MSTVNRSLSQGYSLGIQTSAARRAPKSSFGSVLSERALAKSARYTAGDLGVLALATALLESGHSIAEIAEYMAELPAGEPENGSPESWELDRLLAVIGQFQGLHVRLTTKLVACQDEILPRLEAIEGQLSALDDDTHLGSSSMLLALQDALQKQSQALTMLSRLTKAVQEANRAIIDNMR